MNKEIMQKIKRWVLALCVCPWLCACANGGIPKPPFKMPFSLEKKGNKIDQRIKIIEHRGYTFSLQFHYKENDETDRSRVEKLMGGYEVDRTGKIIEPGIPMPVLLKISTVNLGNEKTVFEKEVDPPLVSWGGDSFGKIIATVILEPGIYVMKVENLKDVPELLGTPTTLEVSYNSKLKPIQHSK